MKQFDDIFSRKVKETFNSFNADHLAGEGWDSYVSKYGKKRRLGIVIPLWAKAASLAAILTIGVLYTGRIYNNKTDVAVNQLSEERRTDLTEPSINEQVTTEANVVIANSVAVSQIVPAGLPAEDTVKVGKEFSDIKMPGNFIETRLIADADAGLKLKPKESFIPIDETSREKMTTAIMTGLSGMMAGIDNTTTTSQGVSFGFYVEQQITRKISVRPGLAMAMHNYGMAGTSGGSEALGYVTPSLDGLSVTGSSYDANIEVLSLEVPVNLVFSIWKRSRSSIFISTGASTVIYLNQKMSGRFYSSYTKEIVDTYGGFIAYETRTSAVRIESDQEPLSRVDFMGLANFSAGYSLPFGRTSHVVFEPFVQLPLKDLTSLDLRIRYGGLSMKVQF